MIYVSLTTIPSRVKNLNKSVESLLRQICKPDKIFINIPNKYKRFKEIIENDHIPKFEDPTVEITRCDDFGPGTKLLGSLGKFREDSLVILADDDHIYEDYMIEKFNYFYSKAPENAYSFYVHPLKNFGVGQGADGFAINSKFLIGIDKFYNQVVEKNEDLFIHDDLWTSYFLFFIKRIKILSLQKYLNIKEDGKRKTIYEIHNVESTLLSNYGSNMIDAVRERDKRAINSIK